MLSNKANPIDTSFMWPCHAKQSKRNGDLAKVVLVRRRPCSSMLSPVARSQAAYIFIFIFRWSCWIHAHVFSRLIKVLTNGKSWNNLIITTEECTYSMRLYGVLFSHNMQSAAVLMHRPSNWTYNCAGPENSMVAWAIFVLCSTWMWQCPEPTTKIDR